MKVGECPLPHTDCHQKCFYLSLLDTFKRNLAVIFQDHKQFGTLTSHTDVT